MIFSEKFDLIFPAFIEAQKHFRTAEKNKANPFFKSKYADLASYIEASSEGLSNFGLAIMQDQAVAYHQAPNPAYRENWAPVTDKDKEGRQPSPNIYIAEISVNTILLHTSGQWVKPESLMIITSEADAQGIGKSITYGRRYQLASLLGMASEENDGNTKAQETVSDDVKKDYRKLRSKLNQALLSCTTIEDIETNIDIFVDNLGVSMYTLTGIRTGETFNSLANEHLERVKNLATQSKKPQPEPDFNALNEYFKSYASKCDSIEKFSYLQVYYLENPVIQTAENEELLNELGKNFGGEDYV